MAVPSPGLPSLARRSYLNVCQVISQRLSETPMHQSNARWQPSNPAGSLMRYSWSLLTAYPSLKGGSRTAALTQKTKLFTVGWVVASQHSDLRTGPWSHCCERLRKAMTARVWFKPRVVKYAAWRTCVSHVKVIHCCACCHSLFFFLRNLSWVEKVVQPLGLRILYKRLGELRNARGARRLDDQGCSSPF